MGYVEIQPMAMKEVLDLQARAPHGAANPVVGLPGPALDAIPAPGAGDDVHRLAVQAHVITQIFNPDIAYKIILLKSAGGGGTSPHM